MYTALDVTVVICAYTESRWADLVRAVQSVDRQDSPPCELIVVIDHNDSLLRRAQAAFPNALVVANNDTRGAAGGRNCGAALAKGRLLAFLDDDAEAGPDWLERLCASYVDDHILGVGGSLLPQWVSGRPGWFPEEYNWVVGCSHKGMPETLSGVRNLIAANMTVRTDVFKALGGFRAGFGNVKSGQHGLKRLFKAFAGDEETEFCIRASHRYPGGVWLCEPSARVKHTVPSARSTWRYFTWRCYHEGVGKGHLVRLWGADRGLESESAYVRRILTRGVWTGLRDAFREKDLSGLGRAAAIVAGLAITGFGYLVGLVSSGLEQDSPDSSNAVAASEV